MALLTAQALAEALNVTVDTIWRYTKQKRIPFIDLGDRQYRYDLEQVLQALQEVREQKCPYQPVPDKSYTYRDYLLLPEEQGFRFEILEGELIKDPSPSVIHQLVLNRLNSLMNSYFLVHDPQGLLLCAPMDTTFGQQTVVQPDLLYISSDRTDIVRKQRIVGPPDLVVEIISPGSKRKDRVCKLNIYLRAGVNHFWLVDPEEKTMECFALRDGNYALTASGLDSDLIKPPDFQDLTIDLSLLWEGLDTIPD
ncbi:MAG: DNA-binding protein [Firmicutes bacterium]|nr:DNA-binding protein [Bacillota bacterium]